MFQQPQPMMLHMSLHEVCVNSDSFVFRGNNNYGYHHHHHRRMGLFNNDQPQPQLQETQTTTDAELTNVSQNEKDNNLRVVNEATSGVDKSNHGHEDHCYREQLPHCGLMRNRPAYQPPPLFVDYILKWITHVSKIVIVACSALKLFTSDAFQRQNPYIKTIMESRVYCAAIIIVIMSGVYCEYRKKYDVNFRGYGLF